MLASRYVEHASTLRRNNMHNEQKRIWIKNVYVSLVYTPPNPYPFFCELAYYKEH